VKHQLFPGSTIDIQAVEVAVKGTIRIKQESDGSFVGQVLYKDQETQPVPFTIYDFIDFLASLSAAKAI
jgi:hypothetical protein